MNYRHAAGIMIKKFGPQAKARAVHRAKELQAQGDAEGYDIWMTIYDAIDELRFVAGASWNGKRQSI